MKLELLQAESDANARKAKGLAGFNPTAPRIEAAVFNQDADDSDSDTEPATNSKGKGKAVEVPEAAPLESEEESSDEDDDEDETAELLRELEKIKRERAEEKEKLVSFVTTSPVALF